MDHSITQLPNGNFQLVVTQGRRTLFSIERASRRGIEAELYKFMYTGGSLRRASAVQVSRHDHNTFYSPEDTLTVAPEFQPTTGEE